MLTSLRIDRDRIALEAHLSHDLVGLLKNTFPSVGAQFAGFITGFSSSEEPAVSLTSAQQKFLNELLKHPYNDIRALRAYVPEGLNVEYLDYLQKLKPAVTHATKVMDFLNTYTVFVSQLISNTDSQLSMVTHRKVNQESEKLRDAINANLGKCFRNGSTATDVTMMDVVARNTDWRPVLLEAEALVLQINNINRSTLNKKAAECADLLQKLKAKIERGELDGVSSQVVENLADGAYTTARELEFFVSVHYKVSALATSINRTIEHFQEVFHVSFIKKIFGGDRSL